MKQRLIRLAAMVQAIAETPAGKFSRDAGGHRYQVTCETGEWVFLRELDGFRATIRTTFRPEGFASDPVNIDLIRLASTEEFDAAHALWTVLREECADDESHARATAQDLAGQCVEKFSPL